MPVRDKSRHSLSRTSIVSGNKDVSPERQVPSVCEEAEDTFEDASDGIGEKSQITGPEVALGSETPPPPPGASARALRAYNRARTGATL